MPLTKVTSGVIAANAVVDSFGTQSITGDKIGLTAINANNIVNATITGAKLAANTITGDVIGQNAVSQNNIVSVSNTSISGNIASSQIAPNQVFYGNVDIGLALTSNNNNTLSVGGDIELQKTVTADGDSLGQVVFWNNTNAGIASGTSFVKDVARIKGVMDGTGNNSGGRLEFYTKADAGSSQKSMDIDGSGRVTMPAQPCFHARVNNGSYITTSPIPFSNAPINIGSNFNTSTYRFTAPIAGRYYFILMLYVRLTGSGDVTCFVRVNDSNRQYLNYIIGTSTTEYNSITMPSIFSLSAGDYVDYTFSGSNGTYYGGNSETNLFGYLLG